MVKAGSLTDPNLEKIENLGKVKHTVTVGNSGTRMVVVMMVTVTGSSPLMIPVAVVVVVVAVAAAAVVAVVAGRSSCSNGVKPVGPMVGIPRIALNWNQQ